MPLDVVIGAQWGDESKVHIVDRSAASADVVARLAGGGSAGHALHAGRRFPIQLGKGLTTPDAAPPPCDGRAGWSPGVRQARRWECQPSVAGDPVQRLERIPGSLVPLDSVVTECRTQVDRGAAL
jgi:hypothetical protein